MMNKHTKLSQRYKTMENGITYMNMYAYSVNKRG